MGCPLKMNYFWVWKRKKILKYNKNFKYNCELESYWWYLDFVVPLFYTKYMEEKHKNIFWLHFHFLVSKKFITKILQNK